MKRYQELSVIGNGAFGVVMKCQDKETGEIVAVKKMKQKYKSFAECLELKEVKALRKIQHENVVVLKQVFRENESLYLVSELCDDSLLNHIREKGRLNEEDIAHILEQILRGLKHIHHEGFFHRDIKPENILIHNGVIKIIDFGLAREIRSRPPFTQYCGTRWYRAPEIMLKSDMYNSPVDIWAVGIIAVELFTLKPPFEGNSETDQLLKIFSVLGSPNENTWPDGVALCQRMGIKFPPCIGSGLQSVLPNCSKEAFDFITQLLQLDPKRRPTAKTALEHPFLKAHSPKVEFIIGEDSCEQLIPINEPLIENYSTTKLISGSSQEPSESDSAPKETEIKPNQEIGHNTSSDIVFPGGFTTNKPVDYSQFEVENDIDDLLDSVL